MRKIASLFFISSIAVANNNCAQDGKILAQIGFIVSEDNLGNMWSGAASYVDAVKKDVELFSRTTDAVFVATEDYVPSGAEKDKTTFVNGKPLRHIQMKTEDESPIIIAMSDFESKVRGVIDSNPKFKEVYNYPTNGKKEDIDAFYERARSGIQVMFIGSDHGSRDLSLKDEGSGYENLNSPYHPGSMGSSVRAKGFSALAQAFRGMPVMQIHGQCNGADAARGIVDKHITESRKLGLDFECSCFAAQAQPNMAATNPRVGEQFESEAIQNLDKETQKLSLLQVAGRGLKYRDLSIGIFEDGTIAHQAKDGGMTGSEVTLQEDIKREFGGDSPTFWSFKNPRDISSIKATKKDGSPLFNEVEQRALLESELERIKAVNFIFGKNVQIDTSLKDVEALFKYTSEKRLETISMMETYTKTRSAQTRDAEKIKNKMKISQDKVSSLLKTLNASVSKFQTTKGMDALGAISGSTKDLSKKIAELNVRGISDKFSKAKHWDLYLDAKKEIEAFKYRLESVSDLLLHGGLQQHDQSVFKAFEKEIQAVVNASDDLLKDLIEPVRPILQAETILSRTLTETKVMKYMVDKDDQTLAKKKDEFFRQRRCELMDLRPKGTQTLGHRKDKDPIDRGQHKAQ